MAPPYQPPQPAGPPPPLRRSRRAHTFHQRCIRCSRACRSWGPARKCLPASYAAAFFLQRFQRSVPLERHPLPPPGCRRRTRRTPHFSRHRRFCQPRRRRLPHLIPSRNLCWNPWRRAAGLRLYPSGARDAVVRAECAQRYPSPRYRHRHRHRSPGRRSSPGEMRRSRSSDPLGWIRLQGRAISSTAVPRRLPPGGPWLTAHPSAGHRQPVRRGAGATLP
mmetsp:Transcript_4762/g.11863  ORF Transcript_4762/g.11863 Transcript_4762/m.11863 type:complete len:220 (+) Transcript_4762:1964-2623(+)